MKFKHTLLHVQVCYISATIFVNEKIRQGPLSITYPAEMVSTTVVFVGCQCRTSIVQHLRLRELTCVLRHLEGKLKQKAVSASLAESLGKHLLSWLFEDLQLGAVHCVVSCTT